MTSKGTSTQENPESIPEVPRCVTRLQSGAIMQSGVNSGSTPVCNPEVGFGQDYRQKMKNRIPASLSHQTIQYPAKDNPANHL